MSIKEAASYLGVSEHTVRRAILEGRLPAAKPRGTYRIRQADLDALFKKQEPVTFIRKLFSFLSHNGSSSH